MISPLAFVIYPSPIFASYLLYSLTIITIYTSVVFLTLFTYDIGLSNINFGPYKFTTNGEILKCLIGSHILIRGENLL